MQAGRGCGVMPCRALPWQWGLGVLLGPPSSGNSPGLLPSTAEEQEAAGLAGNARAARGAPARSRLLQRGSLGSGRETPGAARTTRGWAAGKWGGGQREGQQCPGEQRGQPKDPRGLPGLSLT